jgi:heme/copper-type cytochrome/quinol oxidase subunit 2
MHEEVWNIKGTIDGVLKGDIKATANKTSEDKENESIWKIIGKWILNKIIAAVVVGLIVYFLRNEIGAFLGVPIQ